MARVAPTFQPFFNDDLNYSLLFLINEGKLDEIRQLIDIYGLHYSRGCKGGYYLLLSALRKNQLEIAQLLLSRNVRVCLKNDKVSTTPLHLAAKNGYVEIVRTILERGAHVNALDVEGKTPLHFATENNSIEIVQLLLENNADVDARNYCGTSILHVGVEIGSREMVELLLRHGPNLDVVCTSSSKKGCTPLHIAAMEGFTPIAELLLQNGADVNGLCKIGQTGVRRSPIHYSVKRGDLNCSRLLLDHGANIKDSNILLRLAASSNSVEILNLLLEQNLDANTSDDCGRTALHCASIHEIAKILLNHGASVNSKTSNGFTPLHIAALQSNTLVVQELLEHNAPLNDRDDFGRTPLHLTYSEVIAKMLLGRGARANLTCNDGLKPLHIAAKNGSASVVEAILQCDEKINCKTVTGKTALHFACEMGHLGAVETLLKYNPNVNIKDDQGHTAIDLAHYNRRREVVSIIAKYSAKYERRIRKELDEMSTKTIPDTTISFHDILSKDVNELAVCLANENIRKALSSGDYKQQYPLCSKVIKSWCRAGANRRKLIQQGNYIFHHQIQTSPKLPSECNQMIFEYLSTKDLRNLVLASGRSDSKKLKRKLADSGDVKVEKKKKK